MKTISFHGAAGTVTGSCYRLQTKNSSYIIDCGMYQGTQDIQHLNQIPLTFNPGDLQYMLLTHAHLDHVGRLPLLARLGYSGKYFMTEPTRDLAEVVMMDSARIAQREESVPILYEETDVQRVMENVEIVKYNEEFKLGDMTVCYRDAGHIMGSASIELTDPTADDGIRKVVFSGDIGNFPHKMLNTPYAFQDADIVTMESTYGGRLHKDDDPKKIIKEEINEVEKSGGVLMIPAFAIERSQEILYTIKQLKENGEIKMDTPVFFDAPMGIKATAIYKRYPNLYNSTFADIAQHSDPFSFPNLHILERNKQGRIINKYNGPRVIVAGSGMMTGGRILKHAARYLPKGRNRLLFVGYLGDETLGREIYEGAKEVTIRDETVSVKAHIRMVDSLSAHADENQLLDWLKTIQGVKKIFLTHGEDTAREALKSTIESRLGHKEIFTPDLNTEHLLTS